MKIFQCQACAQPVSFESTACDSCERRLGFVPELQNISALEQCADAPDHWQSVADPGQRYRLCANATFEACNWLVPNSSPSEYCSACRHNRIVPDLSLSWNLTRWRQIEAAKHRLLYSLLRLNLPLADRETYSDGLGFDFLVDPAESQLAGPPVLTGHDNGLITINITEADDVERERRRTLFGEYYRTLLGHFRHEIGHYFWNLLVRYDPSLTTFRVLFGDETIDYGAALRGYYASGPREDWAESCVSAYATAHPWEDFAETFAHYLHIVDTLETASAFEMRLRPQRQRGVEAVRIDFDPYRTTDFERLIAAWLPLTYAMNALNRSMGLPPPYPFTLTPPVIAKLAFVHDRVDAARTRTQTATTGSEILKAMIVGLKHPVPTTS